MQHTIHVLELVYKGREGHPSKRVTLESKLR